jgi:hypothetical protein
MKHLSGGAEKESQLRTVVFGPFYDGIVKPLTTFLSNQVSIYIHNFTIHGADHQLNIFNSAKLQHWFLHQLFSCQHCPQHHQY